VASLITAPYDSQTNRLIANLDGRITIKRTVDVHESFIGTLSMAPVETITMSCDVHVSQVCSAERDMYIYLRTILHGLQCGN
jgi:ethanolamine utilization microcompartment shell protein EutS